MPITKEEIRGMTISEKEELLNVLWESIEKDDHFDDAAEETEKKNNCLKRDWKIIIQIRPTQ